MSLSDVGNLMCLPFDEIEPGTPTEIHEYPIKAAANLLGNNGRNWIPLIVQEIGVDQYKVIGNSFIYAVAEVAELEEVWCIIADESPETIAVTQALAGESIPKTNLSAASREEISSALDYLMNLPSKPLKGVSFASAVSRIDEAPMRRYWDTLKPITTLGCKITKGGKLKALESVFFLEPKPLPEVIKDPKMLDSFNQTELRKMAKERKLSGYSKLKKPDLIKLLSAD